MVHHAKSKKKEKIERGDTSSIKSKKFTIQLDRIKDSSPRAKSNKKVVSGSKRTLRNHGDNDIVTISDDENEESANEVSDSENEKPSVSKKRSKSISKSKVNDKDSESENSSENESQTEDSDNDVQNDRKSKQKKQYSKSEDKRKFRPGPRYRKQIGEKKSQSDDEGSDSEEISDENLESSKHVQSKKTKETKEKERKPKLGPKSKRKKYQQPSKKNSEDISENSEEEEDIKLKSTKTTKDSNSQKGPGPQSQVKGSGDDESSENEDSINETKSRKPGPKSRKQINTAATSDSKSKNADSDKKDSQHLSDDDEDNEMSAFLEIRNILQSKTTNDPESDIEEDAEGSDGYQPSKKSNDKRNKKNERSRNSSHSSENEAVRSIEPKKTDSKSRSSSRQSSVANSERSTDKKLEVLPRILLSRLNDATIQKYLHASSNGQSKTAEKAAVKTNGVKRVGRMKMTEPAGRRRERASSESEQSDEDEKETNRKHRSRRVKEVPSRQKSSKSDKKKAARSESEDEIEEISDDEDSEDEKDQRKRKGKNVKMNKAMKSRDTKKKRASPSDSGSDIKEISEDSEESEDEDDRSRARGKGKVNNRKKANESKKRRARDDSDSEDDRRKSRKSKQRRSKQKRSRSSDESEESDSEDDRRHRNKRGTRRRRKDDSSSDSDRARRKSRKSKKDESDSDVSDSSEDDRKRRRRGKQRSSRRKRRETSSSEESDDSSSDRRGRRSKKKSKNKKTKKGGKKKKKESSSESSEEREIFASSEDDLSPDEQKSPKKSPKKKSPKKKKVESSEEEIISPSKRKRQLGNVSEDDESEIEEPKTSRTKVVEKNLDEDKSKGKKRARISSDEDEVVKKPTKKRKMVHESDEDEVGSDDEEGSDAESGDEEDEKGNFGRKNIRKIMKTKTISKITKRAELQEKRRKERIALRQKHYNEWIIQETGVDDVPVTKKMILEKDEKSDDVIIEVSSKLIMNLKPHQVDAVQFMWNCLIESVARYKKEEATGSGCILAHCMGLGKTLSVIAISHTLMKADVFNMKRVLIICPLNTVLNWLNEWKMWVTKKDGLVELYAITAGGCDQTSRISIVRKWYKNGGALIVGYDMYRNLALGNRIRNKKIKVELEKCLLDPGPDLIVCDEGHLMKNPESSLSKVVNRVKTRRRIVLTGTPLQNNLKEYYTMVNFVKPNLLGTKNEFANRFVNPITNGQHSNSTSYDVKLMKKRAHILYKTLDGCVHRRDYSALTKYLPPKYEYIIYVRLTDIQRNLYTKYLQTIDLDGVGHDANKTLFGNQQILYRVWTHPYCLKLHAEKTALTGKNFLDDDDSMDDFISDSESEESDKPARSRGKTNYAENNSEKSTESESESDEFQASDDDEKKATSTKRRKGEVVRKWGTKSRGGNIQNVQNLIAGMENAESRQPPSPHNTEWWHEDYKEDFCDQVELSGKMSLLMHLLRMASDIGDKVIVFSQSLISLDLIEHFLSKLDEENEAKTNPGGFSLLNPTDFTMDDDDSPKNGSEVVAEKSKSAALETSDESKKDGNESVKKNDKEGKQSSSDDSEDTKNVVEEKSNGITESGSDDDKNSRISGGKSPKIANGVAEESMEVEDTSKDNISEPMEADVSDDDNHIEETDKLISDGDGKESSKSLEMQDETTKEEKQKSADEEEKMEDETEDKSENKEDGLTTIEEKENKIKANDENGTTTDEKKENVDESPSKDNAEKMKDDNEVKEKTKSLEDAAKVGNVETGILPLGDVDISQIPLESAAAKVCGIQGFESQLGYNSWVKGLDYHRLDGSTSVQLRKQMAESFNNVLDNRMRLFLISTRAGGLGINLVAANRVVIFDASWNPSHDVQSIFRTYRFGQTKPVYVYRLIAQGTMEEKIYNRQVTKQSLSSRVIDEMNIERHYTENDLADLYNFTPDIYDPENPGEKSALPRDRLLADLIDDHPDLIQKYHVHDSLLENKGDEDLTEEEINEAWQEFEMEKKRGVRIYPGRPPVQNYLSEAEIAERQILQFAQALCQMHPQLYGMMRDRVCMVKPHLTQQPVNLCRMTNDYVLSVLKITPVQFAHEYGRWMQEQQQQRLMQTLMHQQQQISQQLQQPNLPSQIRTQLQAQQILIQQQQNELLHQQQMFHHAQRQMHSEQVQEQEEGQQKRLPTLNNPIVIDADD